MQTADGRAARIERRTPAPGHDGVYCRVESDDFYGRVSDRGMGEDFRLRNSHLMRSKPADRGGEGA